MLALNTPDERKAHHGIAIGFTEDWIREQIAEQLTNDHGDGHEDSRPSTIDLAIDLVLEHWEALETQPMTDIIADACEEAWDDGWGGE